MHVFLKLEWELNKFLQIIFNGQKNIRQRWSKYNGSSQKKIEQHKAPRYDLEMETLVEILNGERFISCHSYVQSEINMLIK